MKVKVIRSFVGHYEENGQLKSISAGMNDVIDLPEGVDWLRAGFVEPVKEQAESAALQPAENAMKPAVKKRTPRRTSARKKKG